jgi:oligopeptide transport system substrate-binding protein
MTKSKWRLLISMFAIFAIMAFAVACGDDDDDDDDGGNGGEPTSATGTQVTQAPKGTITVRSVQFESWDPHWSSFAQDIDVFFKVWRGLLEYDKDGKLITSMAESMPQVSSDGKTYTVKLKSGLKWSDGQPLDANDFVLGIQRTCSFKNAGQYQSLLANVAGCDAYYAAENKDKSAAEQDALLKAVGVKAIDANTLEIKLTQAQGTFPHMLALWVTMPVPKHKVANDAAEWPGPMDNVYNGPFKISAYTEKSSIDLVPNENWAGAAKPKVEKIVIRYIDDLAVANTAYRAGEIDITAANSVELDQIRVDPTLSKELLTYDNPTTIGWHFQHSDPILAKKEVRLAISQATDRVTLNDVVLKKANNPSTNWVPAEVSQVKKGTYDQYLGFDVAKAKDNLSKAGYPNGQGFPNLVLLQTDSATNKAVGEFLKSELKKHLNIDITLEFTDSRTRSARYNTSDFQLVLGGWHQDFNHPENWFIGLWETGGSLNKPKVSNPQIDQLMAKAKVEQNPEAALKLWQDIEKTLLENGHFAPLYQRTNNYLIKPYIQGVKESAGPNDSQMPAAWLPELWATTKN